MDIAINGKILKFNYCSFQDSLKLIRITTKILKNNVDTLKDILPNTEGINKVEETLKEINKPIINKYIIDYGNLRDKIRSCK